MGKGVICWTVRTGFTMRQYRNTGWALLGWEHIIVSRAAYPRTLGAVKGQNNLLVFMEKSELRIHYTAKSVMAPRRAFGNQLLLQTKIFPLYFLPR